MGHVINVVDMLSQFLWSFRFPHEPNLGGGENGGRFQTKENKIQYEIRPNISMQRLYWRIENSLRKRPKNLRDSDWKFKKSAVFKKHLDNVRSSRALHRVVPVVPFWIFIQPALREDVGSPIRERGHDGSGFLSDEKTRRGRSTKHRLRTPQKRIWTGN